MNRRSKEVSVSYQRHFALVIVKAYTTALTAVLQVLSGLIAIHIQVKCEAVYLTISSSRPRETVNLHYTLLHHTDFVKKLAYGKRTADTIEPRQGIVI